MFVAAVASVALQEGGVTNLTFAGATRAVIEREAVRLIVTGRRPSVGSMTFAALAVEQPTVVVRLGMAGITGRWNPLELHAIRPLLMAFGAWRLQVSAGQSKGGLLVIESDLQPVCSGVALGAVLA